METARHRAHPGPHRGRGHSGTGGTARPGEWFLPRPRAGFQV